MNWGRNKQGGDHGGGRDGDQNGKVRVEDVPVEESLLNHLSLPAQLPQFQDKGLEKVEAALLSRLQDSALSMSNTSTAEDQTIWLSISRSLAAWQRMTACGRLDKTVLQAELQRLNPSDFLILYIRKQNAAIFMYRNLNLTRGKSNDVVFEVYEASAKCEDVLAARSALQWDFPGSAVSLPYDTFIEDKFLQNLSSFIEQASSEAVKEFAAHTHKAGFDIIEERETSDPGLISSILVALLEANGQRVNPEILRKRVRDDVCWSNAAIPWRRLPLWLVLRVAVQRHLMLRLKNSGPGHDRARVAYKFFVCHVLAGLLNGVRATTTPDRLSHLNAKLCRRLVKLGSEMETGSDEAVNTYQSYLARLREDFRQSVDLAKGMLVSRWDGFNYSRQKTILPLPNRAEVEALSLTFAANSRAYLQDAMARFRNDKYVRAPTTQKHNVGDQNGGSTSDILQPYFRLARLESTIGQHLTSTDEGHDKLQQFCVHLANSIRRYICSVGTLYDSSVEQKSIMLLTVMDSWMWLDKRVCILHPLLQDYHPGFVPEMLNVLHVSRLTDMARLQTIQTYTRDRIELCRRSSETPLSIFDDPQKGCFAARFVDEAPERHMLLQELSQIRFAADMARQVKDEEWQNKTATYEDLAKKVERSTCLYLPLDNDVPRRGRLAAPAHDPDCLRCIMQKQMQRMKVKIFEDYLPSDDMLAKVAVFELHAFPALEAYRDLTWFIMTKLGMPPVKEEAVLPKCSIREYEQLEPFARESKSSFRLASTTKSFLKTHYAFVSMPVELSQVLRPHGLKYAYYDESTGSWPGRRRQRPSFAHLCALDVPRSSPLASLVNAIPVDKFGPSSYEIMASQSACGVGVNMHEWLSVQSILSGNSRRWVSLLTELGSSNINFSTEAMAVVVNHIALQAGPASDGGDDVLRKNHCIFRDVSFCEALFEQILQKLEGIAINWREVYAMELIITIATRIYLLSPRATSSRDDATLSAVKRLALELLLKTRRITLSWLRLLRDETKKATDAETAKRFQVYALWASLLCKRTLGHLADIPLSFDSEDLSTLVECSITLQDNLAANVNELSDVLKSAIIRDAKMMVMLEEKLVEAILLFPNELLAALGAGWPEVEGQPRRLDQVDPVIKGDKVSLIVSASNEHTRAQNVEYNYRHGILLVDGMPVGKLPSDHRTSSVLEELFGSQSLLTYPSNLRGMQYTLCVTPCGNQVHVGFAGERMIVRACIDHRTLEYIPREIFGTHQSFDLPGPLLMNCIHWLDLQTGQLEVRPKPQIWVNRPSNWRLDLTGRCTRTRGNNKETLVDPHARLFHRIARNLEGLEMRHQIMVYERRQQGSHFKSKVFFTIMVDLPRLQLVFIVKRGALYSPQFQAVVSFEQDIGTWHGLQNKLVLQSQISTQRWVLVPIGKIEVERDEEHVSVVIRVNAKETATFGKYSVNDILGRIECAPEPTLVYTKALLHALTSHSVPDSLTGKTGTEEALHWLSSGLCQPWSPLRPPHLEILRQISQLTPKREYYPECLKNMKRETWNHQLTTTIQHDAFSEIVRRITDKSNSLGMFALQTTTQDAVRPVDEILSRGDSHLNERAWSRWQLTHRLADFSRPPCEPADILYASRDRGREKRRMYANVFELSSLIRARPGRMHTEHDLAASLSKCPLIRGYKKDAEKGDIASISERLNIDLKQFWGVLVSLARNYREDMYALMFLFAPMCYRYDTDMDLMRTILAFALFEDLSSVSLPLPIYEAYEHYRRGQCPNETLLKQLVEPTRVPPPHDEVEDMASLGLSSKMQRQIRDRRQKHEKMSAQGCEVLVQHLLSQWPCAEPQIGDLDSSLLVDIDRAMTIIRPEWLRMYQNMVFNKHIERIQKVLAGHYTDDRVPQSGFIQDDQEPCKTYVSGHVVPSLDQLMTLGIQELTTAPTRSGPAHGASTVGPNSRGKQHAAKSISHGYKNALQGTTNTMGPGTSRGPVRSLFGGYNSGRAVGSVPQSSLQTSQWQEAAAATGTIQELSAIVKSSISTKSRVKQRYGEDLLQSIGAFRIKANMGQMDAPDQIIFRTENASSMLAQLEDHRQKINQALSFTGLDSRPSRVQWLQDGMLWPITTTVTLLEQLRSTAHTKFGSNVKESLVQFALAITDVQQQLRLNDLSMKGDHGRYTEESSNKGHTNWKPMECTDWLLLEIESNLLIRPGQVDVALAIISPTSGANSVLQMNMGQGKTSCVIPMVALVVANGKNLARVVVPKALLQQTAQLMHLRLGGLVGRELRHIPFSRKTPSDATTIRSYANIQQHIQQHSGVMLCLPEHNMSFMLSGLQQLLDSNIHEARLMIKVQRWISSVSRDVLDESDYTLAVRTQLIYPSGGQTTVDGHPHRWLVAESILKNVQAHLRTLKRLYPRSIEVVYRPGGGFPTFFFLRNDVEEKLLELLVTDIYRGRTDILSTSALGFKDRVAIKEFISNQKVRPSTIERIDQMSPDYIRQTMYLLRGLLVHRILLMTLKKRWNVQYGLHPAREPIAVPFHAKGVPSDQSEFGHPDVAILLTCLSFYYEGIGIVHLKQSLEHVLKSDDPSSAYDRWTQSTDSFPDSLREWNSINTDDDGQLAEIWKAVRYNVVVIDYYLNNFVFPRHAKQFKVKLQSNGWDIPLLSSSKDAQSSAGSSGNRGCLTTGFSGTNDNRTMLPLTIEQHDLPGLLHTNAEVLTYLLHHRNRGYAVMAHKDGKRLSEESFLYMLRERRIKILIDAGAQIVEMDNITLIKRWLEVDTSAQAGLYFDDDNKPWIYSRKSRSKTPLLASAFAENLQECLIYLDEAHTRGTDLKLPPNACGALTLGPGQTKDHTVQAAMRLRQLGTTQSVVFFAPPEVHQGILDLQKKSDESKVDSHDVVAWLLDNTCDGIETLQPLFFAQGNDFCRRVQASVDFPDCLTDKGQREAYVSLIRQEEQQTLKQLYGPKVKSKVKAPAPSTAAHPTVVRYVKELNERKKGFQDTGRAVHASALQEVEQEREVEMEVETVQQVKKSNQFAAHNYPGLHRDLKVFAQTGRLPAQSSCCSHLLQVLSRTGLGRKFDVSPAAAQSRLYVSAEFEKTVKLATEKLNDNFLRPVNWILWSEVTETALILIPEEAENVLPTVRDSGERNTYLLTYAAPITRKMLHFNNLRYYAVPALPRDWKAPEWLKTELGIFSGRLYFDWDEYEYLAKYYAISDTGTHDDAEDGSFTVITQADVDGTDESYLTEPEESAKGNTAEFFVKNPLIFMQEWLAIRRRGQDFAHTPMGYITQGKTLHHDHPFFRQSGPENSGGQLAGPTIHVASQSNDDDDDEVGYEAGIEDLPVCADDEDDSDDEGSEIEYDDDELYPSEEEDNSNESQPQTSSTEEGREQRRAKGRGGRGRRRRMT